MSPKKALFGIFRTKEQAQATATSLTEAGYQIANIHILLALQAGPQDFSQSQKNSPAFGAIVGASFGTLVGGAVGYALGTGALAPGSSAQMLMAVGPSWMMLLGVIFGATVGGAVGTLVGIGTPKSAGARYAGYRQEGGILLSVQVEDAPSASRARQILEADRASDVTLLGELKGWADSTSSALEPSWV